MLKSTHFGACSDAMQQVHGAGVKSNIYNYYSKKVQFKGCTFLNAMIICIAVTHKCPHRGNIKDVFDIVGNDNCVND